MSVIRFYRWRRAENGYARRLDEIKKAIVPPGQFIGLKMWAVKSETAAALVGGTGIQGTGPG
jgi:hypothetical protein